MATKKQWFTVTLKDALYNTHERSGASIAYGQGVVVGIVSALMASGSPYKDAIASVRACLPESYREECIPESWLKDVKEVTQ